MQHRPERRGPRVFRRARPGQGRRAGGTRSQAGRVFRSRARPPWGGVEGTRRPATAKELSVRLSMVIFKYFNSKTIPRASAHGSCH